MQQLGREQQISAALISSRPPRPLLICSWNEAWFLYIYIVRIMQSNQNEVHVKIFSRSWDKWGNKSPRGRCAEILTECLILIMSWENGPDAININSQRNCSGRHFCSNNTMTAVWQCTLLPRNEHFGSGLVSLRSLGRGAPGRARGLEGGRWNRNKGCAITIHLPTADNEVWPVVVFAMLRPSQQ